MVKASAVLDIIHRIQEEQHPVGGFLDLFTGPAGVVGEILEAFRMWHQAEHPAGRVADAGDAVRGAVGVGRILLGWLALTVGVAENHLVVGQQFLHYLLVARDELALAVRYRQVI